MLFVSLTLYSYLLSIWCYFVVENIKPSLDSDPHEKYADLNLRLVHKIVDLKTGHVNVFLELLFGKFVVPRPVFWIRISLNADSYPDPGFYLRADPDSEFRIQDPKTRNKIRM